MTDQPISKHLSQGDIFLGKFNEHIASRTGCTSKLISEVITTSQLKQDGNLLEEVRAIGNASWPEGNELTLANHLEGCEKILLVKDKGEDKDILAGYMFLGHSELIADDGHTQALMYIGQTAVLPVYHRSKVALVLLLNSVKYGQQWEEEHHRKLIVWFLTANPVVYYYSIQIYTDYNPRPDGSCDDEGMKIAQQIRKEKGWSSPGILDASPFVLRKLISARYNSDESDRIDKMLKQHQFDLFDKFQIDRSTGDRLLVVCKLPPVVHHMLPRAKL